MEYSRYNIYVKDYPRENYTLIYNLFTTEVMCTRTQKLDLLSFEIKQKMQDKGILVNSQSDELEMINKHYQEKISNKDELRIMLILTRKCNCKCVYCYEDMQDTSFGDMVEVDKIIDFINYTMSDKRLTKLKITFYGGEPLLRKEVIFKISNVMFSKLGSNYRFSIITNGTLLKKDDVEIWNKLGLEKIKVTIDGNEKSHNSRRPYVGGAGTYKDILNNLKEIKDIVSLLLNIVIDSKISGVLELIEDLRKLGIEPEYALSVREPDIYEPSEKADILLENSKILVENNVNQNSKIAGDHGIICMGKDCKEYVIDGYGHIYRCNGFFDSKLGTIEKYKEKERMQLPTGCIECKYLPICFGECLYHQKCQYTYFEIIVPELLKMYTKEI